MLLELLAALGVCEKKGKTEQTLGLGRFVRMLEITHSISSMFCCCFFCKSIQIVIQQMAHWQSSISGIHGKFHAAGLCRIHSRLLSAGLGKVLNLHALICLNWNSGPLTQLRLRLQSWYVAHTGELLHSRLFHTDKLRKSVVYIHKNYSPFNLLSFSISLFGLIKHLEQQDSHKKGSVSEMHYIHYINRTELISSNQSFLEYFTIFVPSSSILRIFSDFDGYWAVLCLHILNNHDKAGVGLKRISLKNCIGEAP